MASKPITVREAKLVKGVVQGKTKRQAAIDAGYTGSPETVSVRASNVLKKDNVQEALQKALEKHDLTPDRIMAVVSDGMNATKVNIVRDPMGGEDSAFAEETPDHSIRLKAASMAAQFSGLNKQDQIPPAVHFHNHQSEQREKYDL